MKLKIEGIEYTLNTARALALGVLEKAKRQALYSDVKVGQIFRYHGGSATGVFVRVGSGDNDNTRIVGDAHLKTDFKAGRANARCTFSNYAEVEILDVVTGDYSSTI